MTNCNDHSRFVISMTWGSLLDVPGTATSRVLPMEAETSTRNIVTVYCVSRGYVSIIPWFCATLSTHSCTFCGHPEYERWWLWSKVLEVEALAQ